MLFPTSPDSVSLVAPPAKKARVEAAPTVAEGPHCNSSLPTLSLLLATSHDPDGPVGPDPLPTPPPRQAGTLEGPIPPVAAAGPSDDHDAPATGPVPPTPLPPLEARIPLAASTAGRSDGTNDKTVCDLVPPMDEDELGDLEVRFKPENCRPATNEEVKAHLPRLLVNVDGTQNTVYHQAADFYLADKLGERNHSFECRTPLPSVQSTSMPTLNVPLDIDYYNKDLSVVRAGGGVFERFLGELRIDLPRILRLIVQHGECNGKRDGDQSLGRQKRRLSFGCCGQAQGEPVDGIPSPAILCGLDLFDDKISCPKDRESVRKQFADVMDGIQDIVDWIEREKLDGPLPFNDSKRLDMFGKKLREALGALRSRFELFTIQAKNLGKGERCHDHKDEFNCTKSGYTKTATLCLTMRDGKGDVWSVKFITNSRKRAGAFVDRLYKLKPMQTRIKQQLEKLDQDFHVSAFCEIADACRVLPNYLSNDCFWQNLMRAQMDADGGHDYPNGLEAVTLRNLVLEDQCTWETVELTNEKDGHPALSVERMKLHAAPVRDLQLNAPVNIVWSHYRHVKELGPAIQLAAIAGMMCGYNRYTALYAREEEALLKSENPMIDYFKLAVDEFGNGFGDPQTGRISPWAANFEKLFMKDDGEAIKALVDGIASLLYWIKDTVGNPDEFNHAMIQERFIACIGDWHNAGYKFEMGEFRLMITVQVLCHAGIIVPGHKNLHNLVYPVAKLGAAAQLDHILPEERPYILNAIMRENGLEEYGTNSAEGSLCETSEDRVGYIFDYVYRYHHQFCIGKEGGNYVKFYGSDKWERFYDPVAR